MRRHISLLIILIGILAGAPTTRVFAAAQAPVTVYLHGYLGNRRSMLPLMQAAQRQAGATPALVATVSPQGRVRFRGRLTATTPRPLVQVLFQAHATVAPRQLSAWLHAVLAALATRYGVRRVNLVAHSLGNTAVEWYLLRWGHTPKLPVVAKWVSIAGNYDGIPRMHMQPRHNRIQPDGRPALMAPNFRQALLVRRRMPAVAILNLYGDLNDGSHSDGRILNASSRALGFLVAGRAARYQEQRVTTGDVTHRGLRFNPQVAAATDQFLWP